MFEHVGASPRTRERNGQDVADAGGGAVGHHHDAVGEEEGLVDVVRHHERRFAILQPELDQHLLQFDSRDRIEHSERLV